MFARFRGFRNRLRKKAHDVDRELTIQNSGLNKAQIETAVKALRLLGLEERQKALTKSDFVVFLYAMGLNPTEDIIDSKIRSYKLHHSKQYTFGQLAHIWHSMLQDLTDEEEILKRAFQFFDKDGNGSIELNELKTTMHELGDLLSEDEITAFMKIIDKNGDGLIGYEEFLNTLKTQTPELSGANHRRLMGHDDSAAPIPLSRANLIAGGHKDSDTVEVGAAVLNMARNFSLAHNHTSHHPELQGLDGPHGPHEHHLDVGASPRFSTMQLQAVAEPQLPGTPTSRPALVSKSSLHRNTSAERPAQLETPRAPSSLISPDGAPSPTSPNTSSLSTTLVTSQVSSSSSSNNARNGPHASTSGAAPLDRVLGTSSSHLQETPSRSGSFGALRSGSLAAAAGSRQTSEGMPLHSYETLQAPSPVT